MPGEDTTLLAAASIPAVLQIFAIALVAFLCLFAVLEPDVLRCALGSEEESALATRTQIPPPVSLQDGRGRAQRLGTNKWYEHTTTQQRENSGASDIAASSDPGAGEVRLRATTVPRAKRASTRNRTEHYLVETLCSSRPSADHKVIQPRQRQSHGQASVKTLDCTEADAALHCDLRPSADRNFEPRQRQRHWPAGGTTLNCAVADAALRRDLSAAGFSVPLEDAVPNLTRNISDRQRGRATRTTSAQGSDCCLSEALTRRSSILKTSCEAIKLGLDTRQVHAAHCHELCAAGFSVSLEDTRPLLRVNGKRQGCAASLTSGQGSAGYLLDAPTHPASSSTLPWREANKIGLDSREDHPWSGMTTHPEEYYVRDLHLGSFRILRIANKFHAMQERFEKLSADTKLLGEVPSEPDRFRLLRCCQNCELPRCFVQESQIVQALEPVAVIGSGYFKTLAKNIKARHASHTRDATPPINPYADQIRLPQDTNYLLSPAAPCALLLHSHQPDIVSVAIRTRKIETLCIVQSSVYAPGNSEHHFIVPMLGMINMVAASARHAQTPGLCCVIHKSTGQNTAASEVVAAANTIA